jgi:hypothetical protein
VCKAVVDIYSGAGLLLERDDRPVKLHATLINTRLRRQTGGGGGGGGSDLTATAGAGGAAAAAGSQHKRHESFDARAVVAAHSTVDLGEAAAAAVHLSRRGEFDVDLGRAVQVEPMKPIFKAPGTKRVTL